MQLSNEEEDYNLSLKFESMLKTNKVLFLIRKNLKKSFFIILIWVNRTGKKSA
jgi:hypothetical protein